MIDAVKRDSQILPQSRMELLLCLCALNLQNVWAKTGEYAEKVHYYEFKYYVSALVKYLMEEGAELNEELFYNKSGDCVFIRCCGLQFSFHKVKLDNLTEEQLNTITDNERKWDGERLQEKAERLYTETSSYIANDLSEEEIKVKLSEIVKNG